MKIKEAMEKEKIVKQKLKRKRRTLEKDKTNNKNSYKKEITRNLPLKQRKPEAQKPQGSKTTLFKRKCSKRQPFEPTKTGSIKDSPQKVPKQAQAKLKVRNFKITNRKIVRNSQMKIEKNASKDVLGTKTRNAKVIIEEEIPEQKPKDNSGVFFDPSTGSIDCQEGRQRKGGEITNMEHPSVPIIPPCMQIELILLEMWLQHKIK